jgi:hypothetical protein
MERLFGNDYNYINIIKNVFPSKEIRDACKDATTELNKLSIEIK